MFEQIDFLSILEKALKSDTATGNLYPILQFGGGYADAVEVKIEGDIDQQFDLYCGVIKNKLGKPEYEGDGPRNNNNALIPRAKFSYYRSALRCAWWYSSSNHEKIIMLYHTGHDADSIQYLYLETSYV